MAVATMLPLVALPLAASSFIPDFGFSTSALMPLVCEAQRKPFVLEVTAEGELESAINVEVKCEVKCRNNDWIRILEVIPEGTVVKPGDFLVRLDSSGLEEDRLQQQIVCENCDSALALARSNHQAALDAKDSYLNGEFTLKQQQAQLKCFVAEEGYRAAKETFAQSRRLAAKGFLTRKQLAADAFALKKAENDLSAARIELHVLQNLTKARRLKDLDSAITSTKARLAACEQVLKIHDERLAEIDRQIEKCVIRAPVAGQVVLAHLYHEGHSHLVIPGEMSREGRELIRLPDPSHMQVKAEIDESDIALLKKGLPVTIQLQAFPGKDLQGHVDWVAEYPKPQDWFQDGEKKYEAIVKIDTPFPGLRPGLTADLCICAQRETEAVQLPIQSVLKQGDQSYVLVTDGEKWEALPIEPGPTNGRYTIIRSGLREGTRVVLDPASYRDKVGLADKSHGAG
jgi:HlyD family secretion protein